MGYRPEIDGLRAIAVLAVVAFHAGIGGAGFVGVDVFFVISGYLITALLLREDRIDLLAFYARRVRRIFPAAAVVVLATLAASYWLLPYDARVQAFQSAGTALVFCANLFFQFRTGGYWDASADTMPLLHLWSLSVEEQFYLLWPALLMFVPRRRLRMSITGLLVASLALSFSLDAQASFYAMPARFWELAAGGLIATLPVRALPRWVAPVGIAVTLAACAFPLGHFPGVAVLGASLIILAVHGGATNRLLASKPMVSVGLISYSLYLWHWPLLALYRATIIGEPQLNVALSLCGVAFLLAIASYRYVEQPFRRMKFRSGRTVITGAALSTTLALSACAVGLTGKPSPADIAGADYPDPACRYMDTDTAFPKCPDPQGARVAVWGDSMAYAWRPFAETLGAVIDYSRDACPPLLGANIGDLPRDQRCANFNHKVAERIGRMDTVVVVGRWAAYPDLSHLADTLDRLTGVRRVLVIGPSPEMRDDVPKCLQMHAEAQCSLPRADFDRTARLILAQLRALAARHPNVTVVDVTDQFCTPTTCPPVRDGVAMYWDSHHISSTKARMLRPR